MAMTQSTKLEKKAIPAQALQTSMGLFEKMHPNTAVYHRVTYIELIKTDKQAIFDLAKWTAALLKLTERHEALRSRFVEIDGKLHQEILPADYFNPTQVWPFIQAQSKPEFEKLLAEPFQFLQGPLPLWRCLLFKVSDDHYQIAIAFHHSIVDLKSEEVVLQDLSDFYQGKEPSGALISLADIPRQSEEKISKSLRHWKKTLKDVPPTALRPDLRPKEKFQYRGDRVSFSFDDKLLDGKLAATLATKSKECKSSLHSTYIASLIVLLHRYTGQTKICVGTVSGNRQFEEKTVEAKVANVVNCFVNSLPIVTTVARDMTFAALTEKVHAEAKKAYEHQVPLDQIIKEVGAANSFKFMVASNPKKKTLTIPGFKASTPVEPNLVTTRFEYFGINIDENEVYFEFNTDLFSRNFITRLKDHWINILATVAANPATKLSDISLLTPLEMTAIKQMNSRIRDDAPKEFLHDLFVKRAKENPQGLAWFFHDAEKKSEAKMTYQEADVETTQLAAFLQANSIYSGERVGICVKRSLKLMTALMGTLKAGATIVPVECSMNFKPVIFHKLRHAKLKYVLVDDETQNIFADQENEFILLNIDKFFSQKEKFTQFQLPQVSPKQFAYITYTSGSTGEPKAIPITHQNVLVGMAGIMDRELEDETLVLLNASHTFDAFFYELASALVVKKGELHFISADHRTNPAILTKVLREQKITYATFSAHMLDPLDPTLFPKLRVTSMGAAPKESTRNKWGNRCENAIGPAETCWGVTVNINPPSNQPVLCVGKPNSGRQIYIVDEDENICPLYVAGTMYIGGEDGITPGYLNGTPDDAKKFLRRCVDEKQGRLVAQGKELSLFYNTGDRAMLTEHGIEFLGRLDRQIKPLSVRIELESIESELEKMPDIKEVAVKTHNNNDEFLVAYIVPNKPKVYTRHLNAFLSTTPLPSVARMRGVVCLDALPRNNNSKIDFDQLPEFKMNPEEITSPTTELQTELRKIWTEVIKTSTENKQITENDFGIDQSFTEIGGISFIMPDVVLMINKKYQTNLSLKDLFPQKTDTTIEQQAAKLSTHLSSKQNMQKFSTPPISPGTLSKLGKFTFTQSDQKDGNSKSTTPSLSSGSV
jgi:non-ribosomal peptide synthetase component F